MQPAKKQLPARRSTEPLDELIPVSPQTTAPEGTAAPKKPGARKITLILDGEVNDLLLTFTDEFNLSQTSVINWAVKTAIEAYRDGIVEAEFRPARNRIVSAK